MTALAEPDATGETSHRSNTVVRDEWSSPPHCLTLLHNLAHTSHTARCNVHPDVVRALSVLTFPEVRRESSEDQEKPLSRKKLKQLEKKAAKKPGAWLWKGVNKSCGKGLSGGAVGGDCIE